MLGAQDALDHCDRHREYSWGETGNDANRLLISRGYQKGSVKSHDASQNQ